MGDVIITRREVILATFQESQLMAEPVNLSTISGLAHLIAANGGRDVIVSHPSPREAYIQSIEAVNQQLPAGDKSRIMVANLPIRNPLHELTYSDFSAEHLATR